MKTDNILKIIALSIFIIGCGQKSNDKIEVDSIQLKSNKKVAEIEIAKFAIAAIMNQKPEIIDTKEDDGLYYVSYKRRNDGEKFEYKIKIIGKNIVWGNSDGRWRDTAYDEKISFEITYEKLTVVQTFNDGSTNKKDFNIVE
jgi:hypothetical protein